MRLTIEHETHYAFDAPANHSVQYLRLTPRSDPCQRIVEWSITTPGTLAPWSDGFDNAGHVSVLDGPHEEVAVKVQGVVDTWDTNGVVPDTDGLPSRIFLRETPFTTVTEAIEAFAETYRSALDADGPLAAMHALMNGIADAVAYEEGATTVETDADHALKSKKGVCQDHAHLFIACARVLDVPARYVSGYLLAGRDNDSHLASHAWAEAHVRGLGWVSFDPTNRQSATEGYVRLAIAGDYLGACPVRGVREGGGTESLNIRVQVAQHQE